MEIFQNPEVLENALETVALFGMLDKEFAKENKAFFFANVSIIRDIDFFFKLTEVFFFRLSEACQNYTYYSTVV